MVILDGAPVSEVMVDTMLILMVYTVDTELILPVESADLMEVSDLHTAADTGVDTA